jgi:hypothetical protein
MIDASLAAAVFSAIATALAAVAAWQAPRGAAKLAEELRRDAEKGQERRKNKLEVFATLMQERAALYSEDGVRALNVIDVVFHDSRDVREAWTELFETFSIVPLPKPIMDERVRKLLAAIAKDVGLGDEMRIADLSRVYTPNAIQQDRVIKDLQRQQMLASLQGQLSPAANSPQAATAWPPAPE